MKWLLRQTETAGVLELLIDTRIFPKDIVLATAYSFLDKWYFFFYFENDTDLIVQYKPKKGQQLDTFFLSDFYDSLLEFYLREQIEEKNKVIREIIVKKAIEGPLDLENFVSFDTSNKKQEIWSNFEQDIDAILKEIEDTPELQIDEAEIEAILKEIGREHQIDIKKPSINIDLEALKETKNNFISKTRK